MRFRSLNAVSIRRVTSTSETAHNTRTPTTPRTRLLAKLVGTVGRCLHFARGVGRGRRAEAFAAMPLKSNGAMPKVTMTIRGKKPIAWLNNEWEWRGVLAEQGRKKREQIGRQEVSKTTHFAVEVIFFLNETNVERVDLDNLAKPLLDTLFRPRRPQVKDLNLTGALFDVDDGRVFKLSLEKRTVSSTKDEGVDVTVTWE